jgi:hypothetical protein
VLVQALRWADPPYKEFYKTYINFIPGDVSELEHSRGPNPERLTDVKLDLREMML